MSILPLSQRALALLVVLALGPSVAAQPNAVSAFGVQSRLTGGEYRAPGVGLAYSRDLGPWLVAEAEAQFATSADLDAAGLLDVDGSWHSHRHMTAAAHGLVFPVRIRALGAEHRVGVALGLTVRQREEQLLKGTFYPGTFQNQAGIAEEMVAGWESIGEGFRAYRLDYDDGPGGRDDGTYVALTFPNERTDVGLSGGLVYEMRWNRILLGGRAVYRRYRDQQVLTGTQAFDLSLRAGYRF